MWYLAAVKIEIGEGGCTAELDKARVLEKLTEEKKDDAEENGKGFDDLVNYFHP